MLLMGLCLAACTTKEPEAGTDSPSKTTEAAKQDEGANAEGEAPAETETETDSGDPAPATEGDTDGDTTGAPAEGTDNAGTDEGAAADEGAGADEGANDTDDGPVAKPKYGAPRPKPRPVKKYGAPRPMD